MTFTHPIWLLLALPLAMAFIAWPPASRLRFGLRLAISIALLLAMSGIALDLPSREGTVVVVADRSLSMPRDAGALENELTKTIRKKKPAGSNLQIVSFGSEAQVEASENFAMPPNRPESNLQRGLETALSLIPPNAPGRIVLLSDGRWSGQDPSAAMLLAADRGVAIDYRLVERSSASDLAIERIDAPATVASGEAFVIRATIRSPAGGDANVVLKRGGAVIAQGRQHFVPGANPIAFRDRAASGGLLSYTLEVGGENDPVPENNHARFLVGVSGSKPVLLVSGSPGSHYAQRLAASGVAVQSDAHPAWSLDTLSNYSAVILENVPASEVGVNGMRTLASWVTNAGGGLMVTGGRSSFAAGGYFKSPLEPVLPVSMELRREHRKLRMSIVITMDRSGSMAMEAGHGRTKIQLADLSAVQVLDMLSPQDELGVIAVDSAAHIVADLDPVEGREDVLRRKILSVESEGGGIFIYEALAASANMLVTAKSQTRHILLFADANDSEEPGDYKRLLDACAKANITISVVGLGTDKDSDAELLRDIARRGGGQIYFTEDAEDLPRIFAQDTFIVARSAMIDTPVPLQATAALTSMSGRMFTPPPAGGFNLCYLRDGASPAVLTADEYHAPFVASWQAGLGRVIAYTGEADGELTGALGAWSDIGSFHSSLVRWLANGESPLPGDMLVTQQVSNGACRISLQLDPERTNASVVQVPAVTTLSGLPGAAPAVAKSKMKWISPDELSVEIPLHGDETYLSSVDVPGAGHVALPAVRLPYSPEYAPNDGDAGRRTMEKLARATGGKERLAVDEVWHDLARKKQPVPLAPWLIGAAIVLLLLETLERRTGFLILRAEAGRAVRPRAPKPQAAPAPQPSVAPQSGEKPEPLPEVNPLLDALDRAKQRGKR